MKLLMTSGENKLNRNIIETMGVIFNNLKINFEEPYLSHVLPNDRDIIYPKKIEKKICTLIKRAIIKDIIINSNTTTLIFYKDELFICVEEKYRDTLSKFSGSFITDPIYDKSIKTLCMFKNNLKLINSDPSFLLEKVFACEPDPDGIVRFSYDEVASLFDDYFVYRLDSVKYNEDIYRIHAAFTAANSNFITETTLSSIIAILLLECSRGIALTIADALETNFLEYRFLMLYQCIEYLFMIYLSDNVIKKYDFDDVNKRKVIDIIVNEKIKYVERTTIKNIFNSHLGDTNIEEYYSKFISHGSSSAEEKNKPNLVADNIYDIRNKIAHLNYRQNRQVANHKLEQIIEKFAEIISEIYINIEDKIINICEVSEVWNKI